MKKIITYFSITLSSMFLFSACSQLAPSTTKEASTSATKHWGYTADVAPKYWGTLNKKYHMCSEGNTQSPINIVATTDIDLPALDLKYTTGSKGIINNGHTVQVNIADGSVFTIGAAAYKLKQFHFHTPSENHINGNSYPLEAHFVHATDNGKLAVVAVMFEEGAENSILAKIWEKLPTLVKGTEVKFTLSSNNIKALMPSNKDYYKFMGSLTTPPCSEEVKWHVYKTALTVSKAQVAQFLALYGHANNRPVQANNKRIVEE